MMIKNKLAGHVWKFFYLYLMVLPCFGQTSLSGFGQIIQINTRFSSYAGRPSWLLIVRDLDHNQNIPYLFDIYSGNNFWVLPTYGRNYVITVSNMQFSPYSRHPYNTKKISNFCNLETGRIMRGKSMIIDIEGNLTPHSESYFCNVTTYIDPNFTVVTPSSE